MKLAKNIFNQINTLTRDLTGTEICIDQNVPVINEKAHRVCRIEVPNVNVSLAMKHQHYRDLYYEMDRSRSYNVKYADGGLLLLLYQFESDRLTAHRLSFFPNPDLLDFQSNYEDYLEDEIFADIIDQRIVVCPLRFDYDGREEVVKDVIHPAAHLTLGQYENCRIPVTRPLMPYQFFSFVTRNFYNCAFKRYGGLLTRFNGLFDATITDAERKIIYVSAG
jgi:hypothetical protein